MKKIISLLILSSLTFHVFGQEKFLDILPLQDSIVTYSGVVQVDSADMNTLYLRAKKWFVMTYKSAKDVIQLDDKENGEITGKGDFKIEYYNLAPNISHTISIFVKDGRYKYVITQFSYSDTLGNKFAIEDIPKVWIGKKKLCAKVDEEAQVIIMSIEKSMKMKTDDNW